jgi:Zn-dependent protease with chaperone function
LTSAAPAIISLETDSAWVVILAVSLVTLPLTLLLRRLIKRPGGLSSSLFLVLPLALPLLAAVIYQHGVLPEVAVLRPVGPALLDHPSTTGLFKLLISPDGVVIPYTLTGSTGPWLFLIGLTAITYMLIRRFLGFLSLRKLIARCSSPGPESLAEPLAIRLSKAAGLKRTPRVLVLPPGTSGAFAVGSRTPKILISRDLLVGLQDDELEAIIAHEVAHIASRDIQVVLVAGLLRDMVAWNPIAHMAFRRLGSDREFEADRRAAELTGNPLAVASSLVRVCELKQENRALGRRTVLAFRGKGPLTRRVARLLDLSDSPAPTISMGSMPYVAAALLAAVLGLQAGARVAGEQGGAFAIVWGAPTSEGVKVWSEPAPRSADRNGSAGAHGRGGEGIRHGHKVNVRKVAPDGTPFPFLLEGVGVREQDFTRFMKVINSRAERSALSVKALTSEIRESWKAVPILQAGMGSFGIYRIEAPLQRANLPAK